MNWHRTIMALGIAGIAAFTYDKLDLERMAFEASYPRSEITNQDLKDNLPEYVLTYTLGRDFDAIERAESQAVNLCEGIWNKEELGYYTAAILASNTYTTRKTKREARALTNSWSKSELAAYTLALVLADGDLEYVRSCREMTRGIDSNWSATGLAMYTAAVVAADEQMWKVDMAHDNAKKCKDANSNDVATYTTAFVLMINRLE